MYFDQRLVAQKTGLIGPSHTSLSHGFHMPVGKRCHGGLRAAVVEMCVAQYLVGVSVAYFVLVEETQILTFEPASDGGLPALKVTPMGNTNAGPGKVRALGPADAVTYRFDANAERYTP